MKLALIVALLFIILICCLVVIGKKEGFRSDTTDTTIPKDIYVTWYTKKLPPKMKENVEYIKKTNPDFTVHVYDDADCRGFIKNHFDKDVLEAYDALLPGAYKADLWRYCVLYKKGGVYMDIKLRPVNGFRFNTMLDKPHYVLDRPHYKYRVNIDDELEIVNKPNPVKYYHSISDSKLWKTYIGLYNALIISHPQNPLMLKCIREVVDNCNKSYYGFNWLYPTGPGMMGDLYFQSTDDYKHVDLFNSINGNYIFNKDGIILNHYSEYRNEQSQTTKLPSYHVMWNNRQVYASDIPKTSTNKQTY